MVLLKKSKGVLSRAVDRSVAVSLALIGISLMFVFGFPKTFFSAGVAHAEAPTTPTTPESCTSCDGCGCGDGSGDGDGGAGGGCDGAGCACCDGASGGGGGGGGGGK